MPAKNRIKQYVEKGYYHLYNRGVEKRPIFLDQQDYAVFLSYLRDYLTPKDEKGLRKIISDPQTSSRQKDKAAKFLRLNNFAQDIKLLSYCLMPNHFHLLIKQESAGSIDKFVNSLGTRYSMYFNKKNKRVGPLYQGVYKAVLIRSDEQLLHVTRYIHKQALAFQGQALEPQPSSYLDYVDLRKTEWVHPEEVLAHFSKTNPNLSYKSFVQQEEQLENVEDLVLED